MKLKYTFVMTTIEDETFAVPVDSAGQFEGVIKTNETMKDILELLAENRTEEELVVEMMKKYKGVSQKEMETSIHEICDKLKKEGFLI